MDCSDFQVLISPYLDSELSFTEQKTFLEHLEDCPGCPGVLVKMQEFRDLLRQGTPVTLSVDFVSRLQERLRSELNRQPVWWRRLVEPGSTGFSPASLGGLAAAAAFAVIISISLFQREAAPLVEPSAKSMQAGPLLQFPPNRPSSFSAAVPSSASTPTDSLHNRRDSTRRDFSRQMKYVNQSAKP